MPASLPTRSVRSRLRSVIVGLLATAVLGGLAACAPVSGATIRVLAGEATIGGVGVSTETPVATGDVIEVSGLDALVEIQWSDGAFTRLGDETSFTVGAGDARGELTRGIAWNAVGPTSTQYSLSTVDGIVSAGANSTFALRCAAHCDGVVATGTVTPDDSSAIAAPSNFSLAESSSGPATWDSLFGTDFTTTNAARDTEAGFPAVATSFAAGSPALASITGTFTGPGTTGTKSCTGWADECARVAANIFSRDGQEVEYSFVSDCTSLPCAVSVEFTLQGTRGSTRTLEMPLTFDGTGYSYSGEVGSGDYCVFDDGRAPEGLWSNTRSGRLVPTAAEVRDGVFVVTELTAQNTSRVDLVTPTTDPTCAEFEYEWSYDSSTTITLASSTAPVPTTEGVTAQPLRPIAGVARPSVLSDLRSPIDAIPTLSQLAILAAGIVVLALVLGYPAYLLSRVVSDRYDRWAGSRAAATREKVDRNPVLRVLLLVIGVLLAAIITAALDPGFGSSFVPVFGDFGTIGTAWQSFVADLGSWRLVLTALASFVIFLGLGSLVVRLVGARVAPGIRMPLELRAGSLLILLAGVIVSRVFGITPGIIFGLVAGLAIADSIPKAARGRLALAAGLFSLIVGVLAWSGYAIVAPLAAANPTDLVLVTSTELLSALTLEAVSTLPLAFLPVLGFDGFPLRSWRILAWLPVYLLGLALFVLVLFSLPGSWTEIQGDALPWLIGFGAFTVVAIVIYVIHRGLERRAQPPKA